MARTKVTSSATRRATAAKGNARRGRGVVSGFRQSRPTKAGMAVYRQHQADQRKLEASIAADTCGLGNWKQPEGWDCTPFSHTVTIVDGLSGGWNAGWNIYNSGVVVALEAHPTEGPFERGQPYVWCRTTRNGNGEPGSYPTAPIFGRFIEKDRSGRPIALVGNGKSQTIDAKHDQCFRAVGRVGFGSEFYQRSELPIPIPSEAVREDQPMHFECLQHQVRCLGQILIAMGHATDMVDELDEAEKAAKGKIDYEAQSARQARAYEVLEPLITRAMAQSGQVAAEVRDFLKASPVLAHYLKERATR